MTVTGGSSLPKEDIERMMREAEQYAEEDHARREAAETRNQAEGLVYQTEKFLGDNAEKVGTLSAEVRSDVDSALADLKKALEGNDDAAIKSGTERLATASQALGAAMYATATPSDTAERVDRPTDRRTARVVSPVPLMTPRPVPRRTSWRPRSSTRRRARSDGSRPAPRGRRAGRPRGPGPPSPRPRDRRGERSGPGREPPRLQPRPPRATSTRTPPSSRLAQRRPSGSTTCAACRRSTSTTGAGSNATASSSVRTRWHRCCSGTAGGARRHRQGARAR